MPVHFEKGNKKGNRFSSENQPENAGRKPSRFKEILSKLDKVGETLSYEDYLKIIKLVLTMSPTEVKRLATSKTTPLAVIAIASAVSGDIESKQLYNIDRLLDRVFGKVEDKLAVSINPFLDLMKSATSDDGE